MSDVLCVRLLGLIRHQWVRRQRRISGGLVETLMDDEDRVAWVWMVQQMRKVVLIEVPRITFSINVEFLARCLALNTAQIGMRTWSDVKFRKHLIA